MPERGGGPRELEVRVLARSAGGRPGLRILSNLTDRRTVTVHCLIPDTQLAEADTSGAAVRAAIAAASRFAELDPYRAATHNKGGTDPADARPTLMLLPFHPEATTELDHAVAWHEHERTGYGSLLFDEVIRKVEQATSLPRSGAPVLGFPRDWTCGSSC